VAAVAGCGLPRSGPNKAEIFAGSVQKEGDAFIVSVDDHVVRATSVAPILGFQRSFLGASRIGPDLIRPGDTLAFRIWENVEDGLVASRGAAAPLDEVQVDSSGHIFIPYAGRIRAAGNTPEQLRQLVTRELDAQTPDPQVQVMRVAGNGATVSIMGAVGGQGVYPIERSTRTLAAMMAAAGGVTIEPEIAQITVTRGTERGRIWLQDLYDDPRYDIPLRPGDRIVVEKDRRAFTALGATGAQTRMAFESRNLSALEAIAQVGGLNSQLADPTGVFVLRDEPPEIAGGVLGRGDLVGSQRMVYVLDLTEPTACSWPATS
jgi:polysaccharide export outer membrane protein